MTMINGVVTKNGFGIELISNESYLTRLYACFVDLLDEDFLESLNFPAEHQDFLACFTYEIRKMQQGERMVNVLCIADIQKMMSHSSPRAYCGQRTSSKYRCFSILQKCQITLNQ